jgi:integrase
MQVIDEQDFTYYNFINSLDSEYTKKYYKFCLEKFLNHYKIDLASLLKLPEDQLTNLIIKYLVETKISKQYKKQYKNLLSASLKHACEINDVMLNWKKIKKFINSEKTGNETNGRDRGYTHEEIQTILSFCDQRIKTIFLILASTVIRMGALRFLKLHDLSRIGEVYKITIYSGDKEEYFTFCTPECAKEIDTYIDFRNRHGERLTDDSYLLVKRFDTRIRTEGFIEQPFKDNGIPRMLEDIIRDSGLRNIDHKNPHKRKEIPLFHGFRKFFTKQTCFICGQVV